MGNKNTVFENYSKSLTFKNIFALRATSQVTEPLSGIISLCETLEARPLHFHEKFSAIFDRLTLLDTSLEKALNSLKKS